MCVNGIGFSTFVDYIVDGDFLGNGISIRHIFINKYMQLFFFFYCKGKFCHN